MGFPAGHKVDFLICGTQKGGTTALHAYLAEHLEICMGGPKEVHFFDNEEAFANGTPDDALYHQHFDVQSQHKMIGEATPIYMYWDAAPKRIAAYNPKMKLIVLLRNPASRAYSHWNMERSREYDTLPFAEALRQEDARCATVAPLQHRLFSYVDRGRYAQQIERLWKYFPKEQVLILKSEDIKNMPRETLDKICAFLGVAPFAEVASKNVHAIPYSTPMGTEEKAYLNKVFAPEIDALEQLLGWDCSSWRR